jgi:sulfatase maturation enzyme AslB (radical SAM superfamily)
MQLLIINGEKIQYVDEFLNNISDNGQIKTIQYNEVFSDEPM